MRHTSETSQRKGKAKVPSCGRKLLLFKIKSSSGLNLCRHFATISSLTRRECGGRRGVWDAVEKLRIYIIGSEVDDEYQTVVARSHPPVDDESKYTKILLLCLCELNSFVHFYTFVDSPPKQQQQKRLEAHKFKQVLRKLHACHDNKTNCDDLWRRSREKSDSFPMTWQYLCWGWLKKKREMERETENWHWEKKSDINFLSTRTSLSKAACYMKEESVNTSIIWINSMTFLCFFSRKTTTQPSSACTSVTTAAAAAAM